MTCPECELNKQRAQLWRNEAYKHSGHPMDWEPELMVRPKPLTTEQVELLWFRCNWSGRPNVKFAREIEKAHGIGD